MIVVATFAQAETVVPLSNLFDDANTVPLSTAIGTDSYGAYAAATDLGVDRVISSQYQLPMNTAQLITPLLQFDYVTVGGGTTHPRPVSNDIWGFSGTGPIRTLGTTAGYSTSDPKIEDGIGTHANGLITFDLDEIRASGDLGSARGMFTAKIAQNDYQATLGSWRATIIVSDASGNILSSYINAQAATTAETSGGSGIYQFTGTIPGQMGGSTGAVFANVPIADEAKYLTLAATSTDVSSDHPVWSGAAIEFNVNPGPIYLGNLLDDNVISNPGITLADALATDTFKAAADANDLGVDLVQAGGMHVATGINGSGVQFDFATGIGGEDFSTNGRANDAIGNAGNRPAIRTTGSNSPAVATDVKVEEGVGMHANSLVTFDLDEIRDTGGLPSNLQFLAKGAINDNAVGMTGTAGTVYTVALLSDDAGVLAGYVNGQLVDVTESGGAWSFSGAVPPKLEGDGQLSGLFDIYLPSGVKYLTLAVTSAGDWINVDHGVFSGARLVVIPEPATVALVLAGLILFGFRRKRRG